MARPLHCRETHHHLRDYDEHQVASLISFSFAHAFHASQFFWNCA
jgi:hypothetical protein